MGCHRRSRSPTSTSSSCSPASGCRRRQPQRCPRGASSTSPTTTSWRHGSCCSACCLGCWPSSASGRRRRRARVARGAGRRGLAGHPCLRHGAAAAAGRRQPRARRQLPGVHRAAAAAVGVRGVHRSPRPRRDAGRRRGVLRRGAGPAAGRGPSCRVSISAISTCSARWSVTGLRRSSPPNARSRRAPSATTATAPPPACAKSPSPRDGGSDRQRRGSAGGAPAGVARAERLAFPLDINRTSAGASRGRRRCPPGRRRVVAAAAMTCVAYS